MKNSLVIVFFGIFFICPTVKGQSKNTDYQYALIEAVKQKNLGNIPGAIELYLMVLAENDSVAVAHYEAGTLLALTGEVDKAISHLERANQLDPDNIWYFDSYVDVLIMNKNYKLAAKLLEKRIAKKGEEPDNLFKLANVNFLNNKSKKAIRILNKIEKSYGISDKVILLKARIFEKQNEYRKAQNEINIIISLFPESVDYYIVAAELAMKSKDQDLAKDYYLEVLDLDSTNIYALTNLTDYYRDKKDYATSFYYLNKSFSSDAIEYQKKMAILSYYLSDKFFSENYVPQLEELVYTLLEKYPEKREIHLFGADFFIKNKMYEKALNSLKPVLIDGEQQYGLWRQGILLANAVSDTKTMLDLTTDALKQFPDSLEIVYYKGIAEFDLKDYNQVIETFSDKIITRNSMDQLISQMKILTAESFYKLNEFQKSDSLFRKIIQDDPTNYLVMNNFSYYLSLRNESLDEARLMSAEVIKNNPGNATYLDTYAWVLYKMEDYKEAEKYINEALKTGGDKDPDINEHAAEINKELGSYNLATTFYQNAIKLGGNKEELMRKIEEINGNNLP